MRDRVNIAMYLVYLSWTVRRKIVTNKQGQVQAPIIKLMRNITSRFMHPYSSDILIKPNLAEDKATYIGKTLVGATTKFIEKLNSIIKDGFNTQLVITFS